MNPHKDMTATRRYLNIRGKGARRGTVETIDCDANGGGGIRTPETLAGLPVFKTGAINRSATPPWGVGGRDKCRTAGKWRQMFSNRNGRMQGANREVALPTDLEWNCLG